MTSASELFYTRRSRVSRAEPDLGLDSFIPERSFHNRRHHAHPRRPDFDGTDPLQRSPHVRHHSHRSSHSERTPVRLNQGTGQNVVNNSINAEISRSTNRPSLPSSNGNERLPGAVLLARARLLERLRGVSLSGNRRSARASSDIYGRESIFGGELRLVDAGDWEAETSAGSVSSPFPDLMSSQTERLQFMQEGKKKKPPGLTQEALDCLHVEVFNNFEVGAEGEASKASLDCSICLESFVEGDVIILLSCDHRFHSACLDPWVRSCGDCPYCRRDIVVNSYKPTKRT